MMNKRLTSLLLSLVLTFTLALPSFAVAGPGADYGIEDKTYGIYDPTTDTVTVYSSDNQLNTNTNTNYEVELYKAGARTKFTLTKLSGAAEDCTCAIKYPGFGIASAVDTVTTSYQVKIKDELFYDLGTPVSGPIYVLRTVGFNVNKPDGISGTVSPPSYADVVIAAGKTIAAPTTSPTLTGYAFDGWYKEAECTNVWTFASETVTKDTTLYAKWTPIGFTVSASPASIPAGTVGTAISGVTVSATVAANTASYTGNYTYAITSGTLLPTGLSLSSTTGVISGTPTAAASAGSVTVTVTDTNNGQTQTISINYGAFTSGGGGTGGGGTGGGGGGVSTANVTTSSASNGSIKVSNTAASAGDKVTVTLNPSKGYEADTLTVKDKSGATVTATKNADGTYTFTMPAASKLPVSVSATFKKAEEVKPVDNGTGFVDVASGEFYTDAVAWALEKGITKGTDSTHFSPNASCTRAQVVTFLWRAAGTPAVASSTGFSDVESGSYYAQAVAWAVANGITNGTDADHFSPETIVNRAQVVTFLYRYEKATASGANSFTDVSANSYYSDAVTWAVRNNITNGMGNNHFSPENDCTRGQIVTFLYRDFVK